MIWMCVNAAGQSAQAAALPAPMGAQGGAGRAPGPALPPGSNNHTCAVACSPDFSVNYSPSALHTSCYRHPNLPSRRKPSQKPSLLSQAELSHIYCTQ